MNYSHLVGRAKQEQIEFGDLGMSTPRHTSVCAKHFEDYAIREFIKNADTIGRCDYCNDNRCRRIVEFSLLLKFIGQGVNYFFSSADDEGLSFESAEGGYQGPTLDGDEVLEDMNLLVEDFVLWEDIVRCFRDQTWCRKNPFDPTESNVLLYTWEQFKTTVKHKARYVFSQSSEFQTGYHKSPVHEILHDVGKRIDKLSLFKEITVQTKIFRCRQHEQKCEIDRREKIDSPPIINTQSNRMSPAGISMFYGAFDKTTAIKETVVNNGKMPFYTVASFKNVRALLLLDLSALPSVPSMFDKEKRALYYSVLFLAKFISDLTQNISRDGREHYEYVPTQIVTEYFRYTFCDVTGIKIDGIIYPSCKNLRGLACVLFFDSEACKRELEYDTQETYKIECSPTPP